MVVVALIFWFSAARGASMNEPRDEKEICSLELVQYPVIDLMISLLDGRSDRTCDCDDSVIESSTAVH